MPDGLKEIGLAPTHLAPAFLCDAMLVRLGHWLRAAGYDTAIASPCVSDRTIVAQARAEARLIVTRDRKILEHAAAAKRTIWLARDGLEAWAAEMTTRFALDWLARPFSRCLTCNGFIDAASDRRIDQIPPQARQFATALTCCRDCGKLYWPGGHVRRMHAQLARWNRGEFQIKTHTTAS